MRAWSERRGRYRDPEFDNSASLALSAWISGGCIVGVIVIVVIAILGVKL